MAADSLVRRGSVIVTTGNPDSHVGSVQMSRPPSRPSTPAAVSAYRAHVDQLLAEGVWNAQVIFRELQARGYAGQRSIPRDYGSSRLFRFRRVGVGALPRASARLTVFGCTPSWRAMSQT